jgi:hypothetical protein
MKFKEELFEKYEIRKSKKQKTEFIDWVKGYAQDKGFDVNVEKGSLGSRNIVIGDADNAKIIYTAHYDTCAVMPFPNFITPKNFFIYLLYQIVLCFILFLPSMIVLYGVAEFAPQYIELGSLVSYILLIATCLLIMVGPANKHTANDNTSGVATILACLDTFSSSDDVAFILFDNEEVGLIGSNSYASKHKDVAKNTLLVNFDCVSDGDTMLFVLNKKTKELVKTFEESYESPRDVTTDVVYKGVFYPSDQTAFKKGIGVCAMKKNNFFKSGYIDRIHTKNDTVFREENIRYLAEGSHKLYKNISK